MFETYVALAVAEKDAAEQKLSSCMLIIHPHKLIHYILSIFVQNQVFEIRSLHEDQLDVVPSTYFTQRQAL